MYIIFESERVQPRPMLYRIKLDGKQYYISDPFWIGDPWVAPEDGNVPRKAPKSVPLYHDKKLNKRAYEVGKYGGYIEVDKIYNQLKKQMKMMPYDWSRTD